MLQGTNTRIAMPGRRTLLPQRLHVAIWYILRAQNGSHMTTLGPKYIPCNYMEPLGYLRVQAPCFMVSLCETSNIMLRERSALQFLAPKSGSMLGIL